MDFQEARSSFPGLADKTFLDAACVSLIPTQAAQAVKDFLDMAIYCPAEDASIHHINMDALRQEAVHQLGAINLDVQAIKADFVTAGGHKWLNSPLGTGLLYVRQEIQEELSQAYYGYLGLTSPEGGMGQIFYHARYHPAKKIRFPANRQAFRD